MGQIPRIERIEALLCLWIVPGHEGGEEHAIAVAFG